MVNCHIQYLFLVCRFFFKMTGVLHLISLCLLLNLILASDLRHHNECAYCGDNKKCCLLLDRYQCLGAEYACGQIEPYQACHFERCPLLSDSNRKLCMLSGIRYYYCESRDCGNSRNSCAGKCYEKQNIYY